MDKTSSVVAAFDAGKQPSTQQINGFIDWLTDVGIAQVEPSSNTELSSRGRILAGAIRQTLDAYRKLLNSKNSDNVIQEAIWHLTEGELTTTDQAELNKDEAKADIKALRSSLRSLVSIIWSSASSEGASLFHDFLSLLRLSLADAAELVEGKAGAVKQTLREVDSEVQDGQRDTLGRDKQRLEEEKDPKVAWQHGMDTVKDAGTSVIGAGQKTISSVEDTAERTSSRLQEVLIKISDRAHNDETYRKSVDTIFDIIQKRLNKTMDAAADPNITISTFINDTTPEQHIPKALELFRTFVERLANTSLEPIIAKLRTLTSSILRDPELKSWFDDSISYARRVFSEQGFARSDEAKKERKELRVRWRTLLEKDETWKANIDQFKKELAKIESGISKDEAVIDVRNAHTNLTRDVEEGLAQGLSKASEEAQSGLQAAMEQATWFWQDLFKVYLPKAMSKMRNVPIPRTEYKDADIEFVLENIDISSFNLLPSHVYIRNITDIDITTSDSPITPSRTQLGTLTHIQIQALQVSLDDVSFWYKDKAAGVLSPGEFTGLLGLKLPEKGIDVDLKIRLIPDTVKGDDSREALKHFNVIEKAEVTISDEVAIEVKESNHALFTTVFKPILTSRLRDALQRTLSEQLRFVVERLDGVAFDVSKRRQVFEDTGLGSGGSLVAAIWSEIGRIQRELGADKTDIGVHATGTGVIVEQRTIIPGEGDRKSQVKTSQFAMGAEPQILAGEKRGPLGTGSERISKKMERIGDEVGMELGLGKVSDMDVDVDEAKEGAKQIVDEAGKRVQGAMKAASRQVDSFRRTVDRKVTLESGRPGWQSAAFDI